MRLSNNSLVVFFATQIWNTLLHPKQGKYDGLKYYIVLQSSLFLRPKWHESYVQTKCLIKILMHVSPVA